MKMKKSQEQKEKRSEEKEISQSINPIKVEISSFLHVGKCAFWFCIVPFLLNCLLPGSLFIRIFFLFFLSSLILPRFFFSFQTTFSSFLQLSSFTIFSPLSYFFFFSLFFPLSSFFFSFSLFFFFLLASSYHSHLSLFYPFTLILPFWFSVFLSFCFSPFFPFLALPCKNMSIFYFLCPPQASQTKEKLHKPAFLSPFSSSSCLLFFLP